MSVIPKPLRDAVYQRDGWKCRACKSRDNLHPHHIVHKSQGGKNTQGNIVSLCVSCHAKVHDTEGTEKLVILAKFGDPDEAPNADVGLKFKKVRLKADDDAGQCVAATGEKQVIEPIVSVDTQNVVAPSELTLDIDTPLDSDEFFRVEAYARYSKTYSGYVDMGNYKRIDRAQGRLVAVQQEGYKGARIVRGRM